MELDWFGLKSRVIPSGCSQRSSDCVKLTACISFISRDLLTWMFNSSLFVTVICTKETKWSCDTDPHEHNSFECVRKSICQPLVTLYVHTECSNSECNLEHGPKIVVNGTAADEPSPHKIKFITKNIPKMNPETKNAVNNTFVFHRSPPNVL